MILCIAQEKGCVLVLLDLSAAFDTVDHTVLFNLLEHSLGISGSALSFVKSYLHGRSQCIQIDKITSVFTDLYIGRFIRNQQKNKADKNMSTKRLTRYYAIKI